MSLRSTSFVSVTSNAPVHREESGRYLERVTVERVTGIEPALSAWEPVAASGSEGLNPYRLRGHGHRRPFPCAPIQARFSVERARSGHEMDTRSAPEK
jgi:hypothetical protein